MCAETHWVLSTDRDSVVSRMLEGGAVVYVAQGNCTVWQINK